MLFDFPSVFLLLFYIWLIFPCGEDQLSVKILNSNDSELLSLLTGLMNKNFNSETVSSTDSLYSLHWLSDWSKHIDLQRVWFTQSGGLSSEMQLTVKFHSCETPRSTKSADYFHMFVIWRFEFYRNHAIWGDHRCHFFCPLSSLPTGLMPSNIW